MADFKGRNSLKSSRISFREEIKYLTDPENRFLKSKYKNYRRFNLFEFQLYGRVSRNFMPIRLLRERSNYPAPTLKSFKTNQSVRAVNFAVDAFEDFVKIFNKKALLNQINTEDVFLASPKPVKAHKNIELLYNTHRRTVYEALVGDIERRNKKIRNFEEFLEYAHPALVKIATKIPITMAGYLKSRRCPPHVSGLIIEIADLPYDRDASKYDLFVESDNFEFYLNNALAHGFYVDYDVPWRLIADVGSPAMMKYMEKYGVTSTDLYLTSYYDVAAVEDFNLFARTIMGFYNSYVQSHPYETTPFECKNGTTMQEPIQSKPMPLANVFATRKQMLWWLRYYFTIRNIESGLQLTENVFNEIYRNLKNLLDKSDIRDIIIYMERAIADVAKESGSMDRFLKSYDISAEVDEVSWEKRAYGTAHVEDRVIVEPIT